MSTAKKLSLESLLANLVNPGFSAKITLHNQNLVTSSILKSTDVVVANNMEAEDLIKFMVKHNVSHIVQGETEQEMKRELNFAALLESSPERFFNSPLQSIFEPTVVPGPCASMTNFKNWNFSSSLQKHPILDELMVFVEQFAKSQTLVSDIALVGDELITNAVYNAPFVDRANSHSGIDRNTPEVKMAKGFEGQFFVGTDGDRLVIGCRDPYGRLNMKRLFQRIHDCYTTGVAKNINMGQGGAGIGSFMVFSHAAEYYAAVNAEKMTVICVAFPLKLSGRKRLELKKNVHIYVGDSNSSKKHKEK